MGMDYIGKNGEDFHLTVSEHRLVFDIFNLNGADMSEWSWTNRGDAISERSCKNWAAVLKKNIHHVKIPSDAEKPRESPLPGTPWQIMTEDDYRSVVLEFADFLESCGGCSQG